MQKFKLKKTMYLLSVILGSYIILSGTHSLLIILSGTYIPSCHSERSVAESKNLQGKCGLYSFFTRRRLISECFI